MTAPTLTVDMARDKETKGTVRYAEQGPDPRIGLLYVPKKTVAELGDPDRIRVTLDAG